MPTAIDTGRKARIILIALVFFAAALNYLDRQVLALLKPTLEVEFAWTERDYAGFVEAFQWATIAALLFVGWLVDRFGVRKTYGAAVIFWSVAGIGHAFASTVTQFVAARIGLAAAEAVNTPAAMKTAATYLPPVERSVGIGVINTAPNIGAILAPLAIPPLAAVFGWKSAFILTGALGFVWVVFWWLGTRNLPMQAEAQASDKQKTNWLELFSDKRSWTIIGAKFLTDFVWIFMLGWAPDFFKKTYGLSQAEIGWPVAIVFALAAMGALTSGALFPIFLKRFGNYNRARKSSMLIFALIALLIPAALYAPNQWIAAILIGIGLFAHQGFSTNVFAMATDIVPNARIGGVIAMGAIAANFSGILIAKGAGAALSAGGAGYLPMFLLCGAAYLVGTLWVQLTQPKLAPLSPLLAGDGGR